MVSHAHAEQEALGHEDWSAQSRASSNPRISTVQPGLSFPAQVHSTWSCLGYWSLGCSSGKITEPEILKHPGACSSDTFNAQSSGIFCSAVCRRCVKATRLLKPCSANIHKPPEHKTHWVMVQGYICCRRGRSPRIARSFLSLLYTVEA